MEQDLKAVIFTLGNEEYALAVDYIVSIEKPTAVTPIPDFPQFVLGMTKIRDELMPVLDLEDILYKRPLPVTEEGTKWLVVQVNHLYAALLVRNAKEIIDLPIECMKKMQFLASKRNDYFSGVANLQQRLITILDPAKLFNSIDVIADLQDYVGSHR